MPAAPWGIDISQMDPRTASMLSGIDFNSAANAGVNLPPLFQSLMASGAKPEQIQSFAKMISNGGDYAGQFGKYAQQGTIQDNLKQYLGGQTDPTKFGADQGHGGWLQHHGGQVIGGVLNPLDAATGNRISGEMGRVGGQMYDNTFGKIGGWAGQHVFGPQGAAGNYTRHLMNMVAGAAMPGGEAITNGYRADYANARQRGLNPGQANRMLGNTAATSAAALVGGGLLSGLGTGVSGTAGAIGNTGRLGQIGAGAVIGAGRGAANSANPWTGALTGAGTGALSGVVGGVLPGGGVPGAMARGALTGAGGAALSGANRNDILSAGVVGGAGAGIRGGSGALGFNPYVGQLASRVGTGYLGQLLQPKPQMPGNPNAGMPSNMPSNMYRPPTFPSKVGMTPHYATGAVADPHYNDPRFWNADGTPSSYGQQQRSQEFATQRQGRPNISGQPGFDPSMPPANAGTPSMGWNPGSGYRPPMEPQQMPQWMQRPPPPNAGYQMQAPQQPAYGPNQSGSSHADIMASIMGRPAQSAPMMMAPPPPNAGLQMRTPAFANVPGQAPVNNKVPMPIGRQQYPTNY